MAQYVFDASKYPNGTLLSSLDWFKGYTNPVMDFEVKEIGATGRKYWENTTTPAPTYNMVSQSAVTDYEILILLDHTNAEVGSPANHGFLFCYSEPATGYSSLFHRYTNYINSSNALVTEIGVGISGGTTTTNTAPTGLLKTKAMGMRFTYASSGASVKGRVWAADVGTLQTNEPSTWNFEGSIETRTANPATVSNFANAKSRFSVISLGIGVGISAPYPDPSVTLTQKTVTISNIADTTATASWS